MVIGVCVHSLCGDTTVGMVHLCVSFFTAKARIIKTFVTLTECSENVVSVYIVLWCYFSNRHMLVVTTWSLVVV